MLSFLRKIVPKPMLSLYHLALAKLAAFWYGNPSEKLIVIGVTGTNGKSTTVNLIAAILEEAGYKVGLTSTINFRIAGHEELNNLKMTMPGRFWLQKKLRQMVAAGCQYAVIESSSEGVLQYRHLNVHYDVMVFTWLAGEHLERHGGFENYKQAKLEYFRHLERLPRKAGVLKVIVANADSEHASDFLKFDVDKKITYSTKQNADLRADAIKLDHIGTQFSIQNLQFVTPLLGTFNVENALAAIAVAQSQGVSLTTCAAALGKLKQIPGRLEFIRAGQPFNVVVDYAPEPNSLAALYAVVKDWPKERLLHILGSTGGGRDQSRQRVLGELAGKTADMVIVTNEDPYDDDPQDIIDEVAKGTEAAGKIAGQDLYKILDRREAIGFALRSASPGDLVLITGKGAEQAMVVAGSKKVSWDDRRVVKEELAKMGYGTSY